MGIVTASCNEYFVTVTEARILVSLYNYRYRCIKIVSVTSLPYRGITNLYQLLHWLLLLTVYNSGTLVTLLWWCQTPSLLQVVTKSYTVNIQPLRPIICLPKQQKIFKIALGNTGADFLAVSHYISPQTMCKGYFILLVTVPAGCDELLYLGIKCPK